LSVDKQWVRLVTPQSLFFLTTNIRIKVSNSIYPVLTASSEIVSLDKIGLHEEKKSSVSWAESDWLKAHTCRAEINQKKSLFAKTLLNRPWAIIFLTPNLNAAQHS
jgi:hypothetical protein